MHITTKNYFSRLIPAFAGLFLVAAPGFSQHEVMGDPYVPATGPQTHQTSPGFHYTRGNFFVTQVNVDAHGNNIVGDAANEPSIAVNRLNPNKKAIGWRQFSDVTNNFRQAGFGYTVDGGKKWIFPGIVIEPGIFRSDPVLASDAEGRFYYNSLTVDTANNFHTNVFRSTGDGTWDSGVYAYGGDKQWMIIDKTSGPGKGFIYESWTNYYSACAPNGFTRSVDDGDSYEDCSPGGGEYWGTLDVGPDGTLYMGGNGQISISYNAKSGTTPIDWVTMPVSLNGNTQSFGADSPNPVGLLGQTWVATNHAPGPLHAQVYVLGSVQVFGSSDPVDVMFNRSFNAGETWGAPVRINDDVDSTNWQWFGTMAVAPNGRIDVVWLDTRDNPGTYLSSLYYSNSTDGGQTWSANLRLSDAFDPHLGWPNQSKMGDYYHMISDNDGFDLAWAGTFNGEQDVYYGRYNINVTATQEATAGQPNELYQNYPNPFDGSTTIRYTIAETGRIHLAVYDQLGAQVALLADEIRQPGDYSIQWNGKDRSGQTLAAGMYYCGMTSEGKTPVYRKMTILAQK
jgi:hypothetical protein